MKSDNNLSSVFLKAFGALRSDSDDSSTDDGREIFFPLQPQSKDQIALEKDKVLVDNLEDNYKCYLQLLQLASSKEALKTANHPLPHVSAEIANKFDRTQGATVLLYACMNGHPQIVQHVLDGGAEVDLCDENKSVTPIMCAAAFGHLEVVKCLLEYRCDIDAGLNGDATALLWAIKGNHPEVVRLLLNQGASQISTVPFSETPIHAAVTCGSADMLKMLLEVDSAPKNVDLHMGSLKTTPLHLAASGNIPNAEDLCKILLNEGNADVSSLNSTVQTPLHIAAGAQQPDIVKLLLQHGADVNVTDDTGKTPLFYAVGDSEGSLRCLQMLIQRGNSNVNHQDTYGYTALHLAGSESCAGAAEILLMNGADFSIRACNGRGTALSILRRKIPDTMSLLRSVFDKAVTVSNSSMCADEGRRDTTVKVNFKYALPSTGSLNDVCTAPCTNVESVRSSRWSRITSGFLSSLEEEEDNNQCTRKETSKIKCLVDEDHESLLLHPVIHSFLAMKWEKARVIFLPTVFFKAMLVLLFSFYAMLPYLTVPQRIPAAPIVNTTNITHNTSTTSPGGFSTTSRFGKPVYYKAMHYTIVAMAVMKGMMELMHVLRSPKRQLKTVHPYIIVAVLIIMIGYMRPSHWRNAEDQRRQALAALGVLLAWVDIWIDLGRFPHAGLSVRLFFIVLKNFVKFIVPHVCLLSGFILAFTILFRGNAEFATVYFSFTKIIRVMAGDITLVADQQRQDFTSGDDQFFYIVLVYIYTAYVLLVAIVLGNMLIGLAANDIKSIYSSASIDKLVRQTTLLNTAECKFVRVWMPRKYFDKYINLFGPSSPNKVRVFKPFDSSDSQLSREHKLDLLNIDNRSKATDGEQKSKSNRKNVRKWKDVAGKLKSSTLNTHRVSGPPTNIVQNEKQQMRKMLMENINKLVESYLEEITPSSSNALMVDKLDN